MGWERRLDAVLRDAGPFAWGVSDCCRFAGRCVAAIRGHDPSERWQYSDAAGARRLLREHGGILGLATLALGQPKRGLLAGRGDVVLVRAPRRMLGVCLGHVVAVQGRAGVEYAPLSAALVAWSV